MKNHIDNGGRPEAAVNEGNELKHYRLLVCLLGGMGDTIVLVSSSRDKFYKRYRREKVGTRRRQKKEEILR